MKMTLREKYHDLFSNLEKLSTTSSVIDETNVYQVENPVTRKIMDRVVAENTTPDSHLNGIENFEDFYNQVQEGKHGLILMEHYANTDLPAFCYMLEHSGSQKLAELSKKIVAIAGMKLNEADPVVKAFAESFTRVVIYPTRSLDKKEQTEPAEVAQAEEQRARKINLAAMHAMDDCKRRGEVILVFPSGTRYRPGHPDTKKGLREIDSYIRLFDIVILVSINGHILELQDEDMLNDLIEPTKQIFTASPVIECKPFRKQFMASLPEDEPDPKQKLIDRIMEILEEQHNKVEAEENR
ncbi:MAG: 1-acyl-sn-glycerol-3-phosphate acyltransferase [Treponema sp.]|nr:1-acyl-sn-glycerol-3-phosphate acyltransferase [Treponema sp.]MBQ5383952.1 1-acyl-sn-glycerol-3-phosphate acyltransferase [Treponema sp.]